MNKIHSLKKNVLRQRKEAYVNGKISEMIRQGRPISEVDIALLELEGQKLILPPDKFTELIGVLKTKFSQNQKLLQILALFSF